MVDEGDVVENEQVLAVMDRGDLDDRLQENSPPLLRQADANYQKPNGRTSNVAIASCMPAAPSALTTGRAALASRCWPGRP